MIASRDRSGGRRRSRAAIRLLALASIAAPGAAGSDDWHGSIAVTSDYVFRGVSQTQGDGALQGDLHYDWAAGAFVGVWGSSIKPPFDTYGQLELNAYAGWSFVLGTDWASRLSYVRYLHPDAYGPNDYDYGDFTAQLSWRDRLSASLAWSPDLLRFGPWGYSERGDAWAMELALRQPLGASWAVTLGGGLYDQPADIRYAAWNAGLAWQANAFGAELGFFRADGDARYVLGSTSAGDRWSLTALWRF